MEAIKKKMASIKIDKDNAMDRADAAEVSLREANARVSKAEEEIMILEKRLTQIQEDLVHATEQLAKTNEELESKEKNVHAAENEVATLSRKVQQLEEDLEKSEEGTKIAQVKFEQVSQAGDESERMRKMFEHRNTLDSERLKILESQLKDARTSLAKKVAEVEDDLERAEERAQTGELKILELEEELKVVSNNVKSLEVSEEKSMVKQDEYEERINDLKNQLREAETRADFAERAVQKLLKEVDRLEDQLAHEKEKSKSLTDEMDQTFAELTGY
uniref:Tropomyosin n=1 Tax=Tetranychus urticae TaxID=32264 RepID=T1KZW1_TETUR